jgi:magnesium-transporting ATPase (P-type)
MTNQLQDPTKPFLYSASCYGGSAAGTTEQRRRDRNEEKGQAMTSSSSATEDDTMGGEEEEETKLHSRPCWIEPRICSVVLVLAAILQFITFSAAMAVEKILVQTQGTTTNGSNGNDEPTISVSFATSVTLTTLKLLSQMDALCYLFVWMILIISTTRLGYKRIQESLPFIAQKDERGMFRIGMNILLGTVLGSILALAILAIQLDSKQTLWCIAVAAARDLSLCFLMCIMYDICFDATYLANLFSFKCFQCNHDDQDENTYELLFDLEEQ